MNKKGRGLKKYILNAFLWLVLAAVVFLAALEISGKFEYLRITLYDHIAGEDAKLSGEGTREEPYLIRTSSEFAIFADEVNSGESVFKGEYFILDSNIRLTGENARVPVGVDGEKYFDGNFDGQGHTISGLKMTGEGVGLFNYLQGTVRNLTVKGSLSGKNVGAVCGVSDGARVYNCYADVEIDGSTESGFVGTGESEIENCVMAGESVDSRQLNSNLGQYGPKADWCLWETVGDSARLTTEKVAVINHLETEMDAQGKQLPLKAFYSDDDGAWHFCVPPGCRFTEGMAHAQLGDSDEKYSFQLRFGDTSAEINGVSYVLAWDAAAEAFPALMVKTYAENGEDYLSAYKGNELPGELFISEGGRITSTEIETISGRGNDSFEADKKGFSIKFPERTDLLGLGDAYGFNLLPGHRDNSILSYVVQRDLAKEMKLDYCHDYRLVNYYIDGEYMGMYMLTEKMEIDRNRFALRDLAQETEETNGGDLSSFEMKTEGEDETFPDKVWYDIPLEPEDNTGGYLFEINIQDYEEDESRFVTDRGVTFTMKGMHYASKGQVDYCRGLWQDFEDAVYSENGYNNKGRHFTEYIDLESFADQWITYEMVCESSMEGSIYFYKESDALGDGRIHAVWEWDCEHAFMSYKDMDKESWIMENEENGEKLEEFSCLFWREIYKHEEFREALAKEWKAKFLPAVTKLLADGDLMGADGSVFNTEGVSPLSAYVREYAPLSQNNYLRWSNGTIEKKAERIDKFFEKRLPFLNVFFK